MSFDHLLEAADDARKARLERTGNRRTTAQMQEMGLRVVTTAESSLMVWQGVKIVGTASTFACSEILTRGCDWLDNRFPVLFPPDGASDASDAE